MSNTVVVTRHAGAVEWLKRNGYIPDDAEVYPHVDPTQVEGKIVVGAVPLHLAVLCEKIGSIDIPDLAPEQRGKDLSPAEMDAAGAALRWYSVAQASMHNETPTDHAAARYAALLAKYDELKAAHATVVKERDELLDDKANLEADLAIAGGLEEYKILADARPFLQELLYRVETKQTGAWQSGPMLPDLRRLVDALVALAD